MGMGGSAVSGLIAGQGIAVGPMLGKNRASTNTNFTETTNAQEEENFIKKPDSHQSVKKVKNQDWRQIRKYFFLAPNRQSLQLSCQSVDKSQYR